jgi:hypothetical protein
MNAFDTPFKHRVNAGLDGSFFNLIDTLNPSLERAAAIADLIEVACEVVDDQCCFEPDTLWRAAQAIRFEIKDAQILLDAYIEMEKAGKQEVQS